MKEKEHLLFTVARVESTAARKMAQVYDRNVIYISVKEMSKLLGTSKATVKRRIADGELIATKYLAGRQGGGQYLIHPDEAARYLEEMAAKK